MRLKVPKTAGVGAWPPTPTIPPLKAAAAAVGGDHPHVVVPATTSSSSSSSSSAEEMMEPGVVQLMDADDERLEWWEEWANISDHNGTLVASSSSSSGGGHGGGGNWTVVDGLAESDANASIQFLLSTMTAIILGVMILATIVGKMNSSYSSHAKIRFIYFANLLVSPTLYSVPSSSLLYKCYQMYYTRHAL
ncbi:uncharacterized protein LOC135212294 isoform X1 [Macrobrachium nipponense]|uniref:uncharacterized protein LOC135212294 isoform X1 n=1 Tax=Macrobrachium nipponense TaxID=159736 RepID=UPI0030C7AA83